MHNNNALLYREQGATGALLDEYERALNDLKAVISTINPAELMTVLDNQTVDENCRSIQTILTHVVRSGYSYATYVRNNQGENLHFPASEVYDNVEKYVFALDKMFQFNIQLFEDYPHLILEEMDNDKKILVRWGQRYDIEQLFEHAIVHILRHRRQIERFLLTSK